MLQIRLLGQFDVRLDGKRIVISSRAGQSLLAYLAMTAGTPHRREKLAGTLWPDTSDENARKNLRQELWRIRKAIPTQNAASTDDYLLADEFTLTFNRDADYWLDVSVLEKPALDIQSLTSSLSLYQGELLPGFYDDWIVLERERLQNLFESKMERLVEKLVESERWTAVQEQCERWLALGHVSEPAYRALMLSYSARGDMAKVSAIYQRCTEDLRDHFGVEPSAETHALFNGLLKGAKVPRRIMPAQPSGTVTFLFTDIQGSTHLLDKLGEQYANSLAEHHRILRAAIQKWKGTEMDTQGDAFFVTFTRALDALQCAVEAQLELARHTWLLDEPLRVRMGLHTGEPLIASTGYVGMDVHRAARIGDAGHGGQVLLSQTTRDLVLQDLPPGITIKDLGDHRLKDMKYPTPIYQLVIEGLQTDFPPLKTRFNGSEAPVPGDPPFKGLQYFEEADSDLFFGRELLTAKLVSRLRDTQFLSVVIGASGSGKSSLVRAGLIPALKKGGALLDGTKLPEGSENWQIHMITPTAHPLQALATELTRDLDSVAATARLIDDLTQEPRSLALFLRRANLKRHTMLVVDQFEELFTLCRDEFEREAFIDNLINLVSTDQSNASLIITLRADFYAHLAQYPELRDAVAQQQEYIGPMTVEELRRAIEEPAKRGHWEFEPGLVDLILRDVGDEPGALPLLSHALLETWKRRAGYTLTLKGYADAGGVHGAIAHTAESVYQNLSSEEQAIARDIFLRLTELGEGTEDTRRRASFGELMSRTEKTDEIRAVLNRLADARLITLGEDTVEVAHEALIREWPTLREWLNQDREGLRLHRHLTETAYEWELLGRDPGALYRGAHLAQAREWALMHKADMNQLEREFLNASIELTESESAEREAQYQRELDNARKLADAERQRAEVESQRAAELQIINSVQEALASKLEMQAIYDLVGDKTREIFHAQGTAIFIFDHETETQEQAYCFLEERFPGDSAPFSGVAKRIINTAQPIKFETNEEYLSLGGHKILSGGKKHQSGLYVPLMISNNVKGMVGISNLHEEHAYNDSDMRLLQTLANSMSVALENARLFDETERLLKETKQRAEEQARTSKQLRKRSFYLAGSFVIALIMALTALFFSVQSNRNAMQAHVAEAHAEEQRDAAIHAQATAEAERLRAENEKQLAISRELAIAAVNNLNIDPERSVLLSLHALSQSHTKEAEEALHQSVQDLRTKLKLMGHSDWVFDVAFRPDGKHLATSSRDKTAKVWDAASGRELFTLSGHADRVIVITYSPDGMRLATSSGDHTAKVWDANTGDELLTLSGHLEAINDVAFSPDGTRLATSSDDKTTKVWSATTGEELLLLTGHADTVNEVAFSPDGKRLVTTSRNGTIIIWNSTTGQELLRIEDEGVHAVTFSPDCSDETDTQARFCGTLLVTGHGSGLVKVWDAITGEHQLTLSGHTNLVNELAFSPDGTRLASSSNDGTVRIWDIVRGQELLMLAGNGGPVWGISFSPEGNLLASASADRTVRIWDLSPSASREVLTIGGQFRNIAFSRDEKRMITTNSDSGIVQVRDVETGEELLVLAGHNGTVYNAVYSPDGTRIATASADNSTKIWDAANGQELLTLGGHGTGIVGRLYPGILDVAFSPDGKRLATAGADGIAKVWDAETGEELLKLRHPVGLTRIIFSPDGHLLVTASDEPDSSARIWDAITGKELHVLKGHPGRIWGVAFSPDGKYLATGGWGGIIKIWDAAAGEELVELPAQNGTVSTVAFSADGSRLATGAGAAQIKIWDAATGVELLSLPGYTAPIWTVAFNHAGTWLYTAGLSGARVYALKLEDLIDLAHSRVTRSLTTEECKTYLHVEQCPSKP